MAREAKTIDVYRLTDEERRRGLAILAEIDALQARMLASRAGERLPSSVEMLRQARQERSEHLGRVWAAQSSMRAW